MTRLTKSLLCALLAISLLAGCNMPAPKPLVTLATTQPPATKPASTALPSTAGTAPTAAPQAAPTSEAKAAPQASATPYDPSGLPGWFAYIEPGCEGKCSNISLARPGFVEQRALTKHTQGLVQQLFWSPDGKQVAFLFATGGKSDHLELRLAATKTGKEVKVVALKAGAVFGSVNWSRNGKYLVYAAAEKGKNGQVYRVNVETKKVQKLSKSAKIVDEDPVWSPDGKKIAFVSDRKLPSGPVGHQIWTMKADGSSAKALIPDRQENNGWFAFKPAWSPDGKQIAFVWLPPIDLHAGSTMQLSRLDENAGGLWVMDANGGQPKPLAPCGTPPTEAPVWSPDGKHIAFACGDTSQSLVVVNLADASQLKTGAAEGLNYNLSWSPDSKAVSYMKKVGDNQRTMNLFVLGGQAPIEDSAKTAFDSVVWSPVEKLP